MSKNSTTPDAVPVPGYEADFSDVPEKRAGSAGNLAEDIRRKHSGSRILVVDDVELNLEVARLLLRRIGLHADTAINGRQAVDRVRTTAYAAVLMDVQMPEMDGLEATRAIRALPGRSGTPILAITANVFPEHRRECFAAGMDDFITKPVHPDTLYAALGKWLPPAGATPNMALSVRDETMQADVTPLSLPSAASITPPTQLRRRLAEVVGLDVENGLGRLRGNEAKYAQVLALFVRGHELDQQTIAAALHGGKTSVAEQLVHALKGTAGLIGATAVAGAAAALLTTLRQSAGRDEIDQGYAELAARLGELIDGLKQAQDGEPAIATVPLIDTARGAEVLRLLEALLEAGDMRASILARTENQLLHAALGDAADTVLSAIELFDFERALAALRVAKVQRPQPN